MAMQIPERLMHISKHFFIYSVIGVSGAVLDFFIFSCAVCVGTNYIVANAVGVICGISNNFILNAHYNFKTKSNFFMRFLSFFCVGIFGLFLSSFFLYLNNIYFQVSIYIAKFATIFVVAITQYLLNKTITFRGGDERVRRCNTRV
jgi:Predicted membrane protein